jgi:hypothetical protein
MTPDESRNLNVGQRVAWHDRSTDKGTVIATDWSGVKIAWDDGKEQFFHHNDMTEVSIRSANPSGAASLGNSESHHHD